MTLALILATVKTAEGEVSTVTAPIKSLQLNDSVYYQDAQPIFQRTTNHKTLPAAKEEISASVAYFASLYGSSAEEMMVTLNCESGYRHDGVYGDSGLAYGIAQFHEPTFNGFKKSAGLPELDYMNREDQIQLMAWAFSSGLKRHWTCWTKNYGV